MTSLLRRVLTPSPQHRHPSSSAELFSPEGLGHDAHHLSLCIRETLLVSFSNRRLSRPSTELIAHKSTTPCWLSNQLLLDHHELRLHIIQRSVRCHSRTSPKSLNSRPTCWPLSLSNTALSTRQQHVYHSGLVWLLLETCCQPNGLTHQCGLFAPSVDSRPCSSTRWLLDVANPLVARLHPLNLVRWSCDSIASSTWLSTSSSVWFSTAFSSSFCWFSSANWSHQHQLLFDTTLQLGNSPSPSSWWPCTALLPSLISVCRAKASSCSLPLTLSGNVLAHLPPSSSSHHFSQTPHQNPDKSEFQLLIFFACACSPHSHQNCVSPDCSFVPHSNLLTAITDSRHCLLLALLFCLRLALLFLHGFLGSDPGCVFLRGSLGSDPGCFSLDHHFSAHSAELSRFCLHFVVVYSAVFADSCLAPPTLLCGCRFAVSALASRSRYVTTTLSAVWAPCHIRYSPSRVQLTVSLCLVHAGVSTSLNSVARLLLNADFRLVLNASLSFLPGSSRASCTSEPARKLSGPCASASKCNSAGTQHHLLDLTVASTLSSESSAPVFPLCTLHGVLITPLASFSLSEYWLLYPSNRWHMSLSLDNVSFHSYMTQGPVLLPAPSVCCQISSTSTFMPVYSCCETSTVCGAFWLFMSMWCTCVLETSDTH